VANINFKQGSGRWRKQNAVACQTVAIDNELRLWWVSNAATRFHVWFHQHLFILAYLSVLLMLLKWRDKS